MRLVRVEVFTRELVAQTTSVERDSATMPGRSVQIV
jgi:hypothetical protein